MKNFTKVKIFKLVFTIDLTFVFLSEDNDYYQEEELHNTFILFINITIINWIEK